VGPRGILDAVVKRIIPSPHQESNPSTNCPVHGPAIYQDLGVQQDDVENISDSRERKWQEAGEDCIMRSFVTCELHHIIRVIKQRM
jgi:hypothetical protein